MSKTGITKRKSQERGKGLSARALHLPFCLAVEQRGELALAPATSCEDPPVGSPSLEGVVPLIFIGKSQLGEGSDVGSGDVNSYAM